MQINCKELQALIEHNYAVFPKIMLSLAYVRDSVLSFLTCPPHAMANFLSDSL